MLIVFFFIKKKKSYILILEIIIVANENCVGCVVFLFKSTLSQNTLNDLRPAKVEFFRPFNVHLKTYI